MEGEYQIFHNSPRDCSGIGTLGNRLASEGEDGWELVAVVDIGR